MIQLWQKFSNTNERSVGEVGFSRSIEYVSTEIESYYVDTVSLTQPVYLWMDAHNTSYSYRYIRKWRARRRELYSRIIQKSTQRDSSAPLARRRRRARRKRSSAVKANNFNRAPGIFNWPANIGISRIRWLKANICRWFRTDKSWTLDTDTI